MKTYCLEISILELLKFHSKLKNFENETKNGLIGHFKLGLGKTIVKSDASTQIFQNAKVCPKQKHFKFGIKIALFEYF